MNLSGRWTRVLFGAGAVACVWFSALSIETAARLISRLFVHFGTDLPTPTLLALDAIQRYVPWIVAMVSTVIVIYLGIRTSAYFLHACALAAATAAVLVSFAAISLVLPMVMCGDYWPAWPHQSAGATGHTPGAKAKANRDSPGTPVTSSCGP